MNNGYKEVYMPTHPFSMSSGCIYEHRLMAEKKLGRYLKPEEYVHHIDGNKINNTLDNLIVFKTNSDHSAFHKGKHIHLENDVWVAENVSTKQYSLCPVCQKNYIEYDSNMCRHCCDILQRKVNRPTKDELKQLIINYPMLQIGKMFGVSDNAIRKWCKFYRLPYKRKDIQLLKNTL